MPKRGQYITSMHHSSVPKKVNRHVLKALTILSDNDYHKNISEERIVAQVEYQMRNLLPIRNFEAAVGRSLNAMTYAGVIERHGSHSYSLWHPPEKPGPSKPQPFYAPCVKGKRVERCNSLDPNRKRRRSDDSLTSDDFDNACKRIHQKSKSLKRIGRRTPLPKARQHPYETSLLGRIGTPRGLDCKLDDYDHWSSHSSLTNLLSITLMPESILPIFDRSDSLDMTLRHELEVAKDHEHVAKDGNGRLAMQGFGAVGPIECETLAKSSSAGDVTNYDSNEEKTLREELSFTGSMNSASEEKDIFVESTSLTGSNHSINNGNETLVEPTAFTVSINSGSKEKDIFVEPTSLTGSNHSINNGNETLAEPTTFTVSINSGSKEKVCFAESTSLTGSNHSIDNANETLAEPTAFTENIDSGSKEKNALADAPSFTNASKETETFAEPTSLTSSLHSVNTEL